MGASHPRRSLNDAQKSYREIPMSDGSGLIEINVLCKIRILVLIFNSFFMANTIFLILKNKDFPSLGTLITFEFCC